MPIRWRLHIITGLILAAVTIAAVTPALIDTLLCTPTGRRYTAAAAGALDALSREVANILLPLGPGGGARCPRLEAGALVLALQLCCGLVAPSLYLYISELRWVGCRVWGAGSLQPTACVSMCNHLVSLPLTLVCLVSGSYCTQGQQLSQCWAWASAA
jgi:hypothetical protein